MSRPITTLVPYFGSNRSLAAHVGRALDGCAWVGIPFAGGMCELRHVTARTIHVNDLNRAVINLARVVGHERQGPRLYRRLRRRAFHPDQLAASQVECREQEPVIGDLFAPEPGYETIPDIEWAEAYFVACWMGRSGLAGTDGELTGKLAARWTASGGDSAVRYQSAVRGLVEWRRLLRRCTFSTDDCFDFLTRCRDDEGVGVYCDPPFPDAGDAYKHAFTYDDHRKLADHLKRFCRARVVCRFYDHPLIRDLYPEDGPWPWRWHHLDGGKTQTNAAAPEVLLCNQQEIFA